MIKVINLSNGEIIKVWKTEINAAGQIVKDGAVSTRYLNAYPFLTLNDDGTLSVIEGYEVLKGRKKTSPSVPTAPESTNEPTPTAEPKTTPAIPVAEASEDEALAAAAILKLLRQPKAAELDEAKVRTIVEGVLAEHESKPTELDEAKVRTIVEGVLAEHESKPRIVKIQVNNAEPRELPDGQTPHPLLPLVLKMVANDRITGRFPWLYGPAGSGKSTLAKQVADALGLPFYSVSSLQQKYELEGYTDAVGEFVETVAYKAMTGGGVLCFDEMSTTAPEVQVAFNTLAAQLVYNFPKHGMVKAHPDFHIIAADNTVGRGGDKSYNARFQLDASTIDRYMFVKVDYSREQDLRMANGDENLVEFICDMRRVLEEANTTYLATPRAIRAIAACMAMDMTTEESLQYGLCGGWKAQDIRTFAQRITCDNVYGHAFKKLARKL